MADQVRHFCDDLERAGGVRGWQVRQAECLGHANVETTMIYTHVVKELRNPARSPADLLQERIGK